MKLLTKMAKRFVAGDKVEEAIAVVEKLQQRGIFSTLDILGENVTDQEGAKKLVDDYSQLIDLIPPSNDDHHGAINISLKLTMLGLDISEVVCENNLRQLLEKAKQNGGIFVRIDMEGSKYTQATLDIFLRVRHQFENVGIVLQAYLKRTLDDVVTVIQRGGSIRLCKGAYKEPADIAFQSTSDIRTNYLKCVKVMFQDKGRHAIATHDKQLLNDLATCNFFGARPKSFEIQMLYGMRRSYWPKYVDQGYHVRIYVPFGPDWLPYFSRRLSERKENIFFVLTHLFSK